MEPIQSAKTLSTEELVAFLIKANQAYREGTALIDDTTYDHVYLAELISRDPNHPFLLNVEPEGDFGIGKIKHEKPMLSTDKAYTSNDIKKFIKRVEAAALKIGLTPEQLLFRITPKLDGMAGCYSNGKLVTRGNGDVGNDVTHMFKRGVVRVGGSNTGLGEIVLRIDYWENNLTERFSHPRNVIVGLVGADNINDDSSTALAKKAVHFVPYSKLNSVTLSSHDLITNLESICSKLEVSCGYPTDGSVFEVTDESVKNQMGFTGHHYRWQVARKTIGETAVSVVKNINWQTGRTGRVTPIISIEKTWLSGAWIKKVTGHHAGNIRNLQIGHGCEILLVRSGEVIPKLLEVIKAGAPAVIPTTCTSCAFELHWVRDFLMCGNSRCTAKKANRLLHFFSTIGNIDLFGEKTIALLLENGIDELTTIYAMKTKDFESIGFGPKQAQNLERELMRSLTESIEDWRFLASFGIQHLGCGDSRKLLLHFKLAELEVITSDRIQKLDSFGPQKAPAIASGLQSRWSLIENMMRLGFNLNSNRASLSTSPIKGLNIVFSGTMKNSRKKLQTEALGLGVTLQTTVTSNTDILVTGENVGRKKIEAARIHKTRVLGESDYLSLIA